MRSDVTGAQWIEGSKVLSLNQWYHISMVRDGSYIKLYIDGVLDAQSTNIGTEALYDSVNNPDVIV